MNNEIIKEGDYIEYVGRPNEKFLVKKSCDKEFMYILLDGDRNALHFYETGILATGDTNPIVKKTIPPKKKVLKEFDVYIDKLPTNLHGDHGTFYSRYTPVREIKAKLIVEVEE